MLVVSMLFVWLWCCFAVRVEAERDLRPYGSGNCWAMRLHPGRAETISTSSGLTQQKTSNITKQELQTPFRIAIVKSERFKSGLARDCGISLWVKQKPCLKRKKSALNGKWQTEHSRTKAERGFSGRFRTAPAPPAAPGQDARTEKTALIMGGGR